MYKLLRLIIISFVCCSINTSMASNRCEVCDGSESGASDVIQGLCPDATETVCINGYSINSCTECPDGSNLVAIEYNNTGCMYNVCKKNNTPDCEIKQCSELGVGWQGDTYNTCNFYSSGEHPCYIMCESKTCAGENLDNATSCNFYPKVHYRMILGGGATSCDNYEDSDAECILKDCTCNDGFEWSAETAECVKVTPECGEKQCSELGDGWMGTYDSCTEGPGNKCYKNCDIDCNKPANLPDNATKCEYSNETGTGTQYYNSEICDGVCDAILDTCECITKYAWNNESDMCEEIHCDGTAEYWDGNACIACPENATCNGLTFECTSGYYPSENAVCAKCPDGGTSNPNAKSITDCFVGADAVQWTDNRGTYTCSQNAYFEQ